MSGEKVETYWVRCTQPDGHESWYRFSNENEAVGFLVHQIVMYRHCSFGFERRMEGKVT